MSNQLPWPTFCLECGSTITYSSLARLNPPFSLARDELVKVDPHSSPFRIHPTSVSCPLHPWPNPTQEKQFRKSLLDNWLLIFFQDTEPYRDVEVTFSDVRVQPKLPFVSATGSFRFAAVAADAEICSQIATWDLLSFFQMTNYIYTL